MKGNGNIDEYSNERPILGIHPETGKKILFVNSMYIKKLLTWKKKKVIKF
jgi:alpha-ketoglutarate-dependent taurine dioxygenase